MASDGIRLAFGLLVGLGCGFVLGRVTTPLGAPPPAPTHPSTKEAKMPLASKAPHAGSAPEPTTQCIQKGCTCPPPPPEQLQAALSEDGVNQWVADLNDSCPGFADRAKVVDCEEFPCLLAVAHAGDGRLSATPNPEETVLCEGEGGLPATFKGNGGGPEGFWFIFAIRPEDVRDYVRGENARALGMDLQ